MPISDHPTDSVALALSELEPGTRALLDLSLRRALSDDELAKLVATDPGQLALRRARTLDEIAAKAGIDGPGAREQVTARLLAVSPQVWLAAGSDRPTAQPPPAPSAEPNPETALGRAPIKDPRRAVGASAGASVAPPPGNDPLAAVAAAPQPPAATPPRTGTRNRVTALLALLLAAALVAIVLLQMAGGADESAPATPPTQNAPAEPMPT